MVLRIVKSNATEKRRLEVKISHKQTSQDPPPRTPPRTPDPSPHGDHRTPNGHPPAMIPPADSAKSIQKETLLYQIQKLSNEIFMLEKF